MGVDGSGGIHRPSAKRNRERGRFVRHAFEFHSFVVGICCGAPSHHFILGLADGRCEYHGDAPQGLTISTPHPSKSDTLRVARVAPRDWAIAAI
jgi:hypothetical protein